VDPYEPLLSLGLAVVAGLLVGLEREQSAPVHKANESFLGGARTYPLVALTGALATLLGRPYSISGHVLHGRKLGRALGEGAPGRGDGFRTLNLRFAHRRPAAMGIFIVRVHGLAAAPLPGVASLGVRPTLGDNGRVLLETHCLAWPPSLGPDGAYGRVVRVELLHKLHDERQYASLDALRAGIAVDVAAAQAWFAAVR